MNCVPAVLGDSKGAGLVGGAGDPRICDRSTEHLKVSEPTIHRSAGQLQRGPEKEEQGACCLRHSKRPWVAGAGEGVGEQ